MKHTTKTNNTINIGEKMRYEASLYTKRVGKRVQVENIKVSKDAVSEYLSYLKAYLESDMALLTDHIKEEGRNTVMEKDIIWLFGHIRRGKE